MEIDGSHRFSMVSPGRKYRFHRLEPPPQVLTLGFSGVPHCLEANATLFGQSQVTATW